MQTTALFMESRCQIRQLINSMNGENDPLKQVTLGIDPRTGFGALTGKIAE